MRAIIVGHGPSLLDKDYGEEIDSYDYVVRLKRSAELLKRPKIFGSKTDVVCGSVVLWEQMFKEWRHVRPDRTWLFLDTRTFHITDEDIKSIECYYRPQICIIDRRLCLDLVAQYRMNRENQDLDNRQEVKISGGIALSDERGHLHCSAGMFAVAYLLKFLKPDEFKMIGFDNIAKGYFDWSITRGPDWDQYPDHNWQAEYKLFRQLTKGYELKADGGELCLNMLHQ